MTTFDGTSVIQLAPLTYSSGISKRSTSQVESERHRRDTVVNLELSYWFQTSIDDGVLLLASGVIIIYFTVIILEFLTCGPMAQQSKNPGAYSQGHPPLKSILSILGPRRTHSLEASFLRKINPY